MTHVQTTSRTSLFSCSFSSWLLYVQSEVAS